MRSGKELRSQQIMKNREDNNMKQLKTVIVLLLILLLTLSFAGCGSKDSSDSGDTPDEQSQDVDQNDDAQDDEETADETDTETSDEIWDEEDLEDLDDDPDADADVDEDTEDEEEDEDAEEEEEPIEAPAELTGDYTGAFVSNTETPLNLNVQWAADKASDGTYDVTLQFYLECYSIQVSERSGNKLKVKTSSETKEYSFKTKEVMRENNTLEKVMIGETKIKLSEEELLDGAKVEASWDFRGSYSGTDLPEVVAKGEIKGN